MMSRKELKALSWDQFIDKIWTIFLLGIIYVAIASAAGGMIGSVIGIPMGIVAGVFTLGIEDPEVAAAISSLASSVASMFASALAMFADFPFSFSFAMIYLDLTNGETPKVVDIFAGFKKYWRAMGIYFFQKLFVSLWTLLFIIPGIIKSYSYAMAPYIAIEHPELSPLECIAKSKEMMNGHKGELFVLDLSFLGWGLLTIVSCGIAGIWYTPYYYTTHANFYKQLKGEI